MKGFEELYGIPSPQAGVNQPIKADDLMMMAFDTAKEDVAFPDYLKAVVILANKVASLDASVSMLRHREPFAPLTGVLASMEDAIEKLTQSCMSLFEFATANNVLEILDRDFQNQNINEEEK